MNIFEIIIKKEFVLAWDMSHRLNTGFVQDRITLELSKNLGSVHCWPSENTVSNHCQTETSMSVCFCILYVLILYMYIII